ncbi:MAG: hypothetical protein K6G31_05245 [Paludibacteraceae bacterium]|nr:hypothetical protein [Paludibacteraceae bacterium]
MEELRRCIVNHTFETIMSKEKQMSPSMITQYQGVEFMLKFCFTTGHYNASSLLS